MLAFAADDEIDLAVAGFLNHVTAFEECFLAFTEGLAFFVVECSLVCGCRCHDDVVRVNVSVVKWLRLLSGDEDAEKERLRWRFVYLWGIASKRLSCEIKHNAQG